MSRCIKMAFALDKPSEKFLQAIQKHARTFQIEGLLMAHPGEGLKVIACGEGESIDAFLDALDEVVVKYGGQHISSDSFLKDKDYRGVFRIML